MSVLLPACDDDDHHHLYTMIITILMLNIKYCFEIMMMFTIEKINNLIMHENHCYVLLAFWLCLYICIYMTTMYNNDASTHKDHFVHFSFFTHLPLCYAFLKLKANNYYSVLSNSHLQKSTVVLISVIRKTTYEGGHRQGEMNETTCRQQQWDVLGHWCMGGAGLWTVPFVACKNTTRKNNPSQICTLCACMQPYYTCTRPPKIQMYFSTHCNVVRTVHATSCHSKQHKSNSFSWRRGLFVWLWNYYVHVLH